MFALRVVFDAPVFNDLPGVLHGHEPVFVQALVAELAVEALDVCILIRLTRSDERQLHFRLGARYYSYMLADVHARSVRKEPEPAFRTGVGDLCQARYERLESIRAESGKSARSQASRGARLGPVLRGK